MDFQLVFPNKVATNISLRVVCKFSLKNGLVFNHCECAPKFSKVKDFI